MDRTRRKPPGRAPSPDGQPALAGAHATRASAGGPRHPLEFLANASSLLAASLDFETTLKNVARLAVPTLADLCVFDLVAESGAIQRVAWFHADPAQQATFDEVWRFVPEIALDRHPVAKALRTGRTEFVPELTDAWMEEVATGSEHLRLMHELAVRSLITVPLMARERVLGAVSLCRVGTSPPYTPDDVRLAEELARRAAVAIDNARLFQEARNAEARYHGLFTSAADAIVIADDEGRYLDANPAASELLGYSRDELLGLRVVDVVAVGSEWTESEYERFRNEGSWRGELDVRRKDGAVLAVEAQATVVPAPNGPMYVSALRNISERRALERLQREFIAMVTHELRTPLTAISGYAQLLRRRQAYSESAVDAILRQVQNQERLLQDLLDAARVETRRLELQRSAVDLTALVQACVDQLRSVTPACAVRVEAPARAVKGWWDRGRVEQVLNNLLSNAAKHSPDGCDIEVRVEVLETEARVSVRDRGLGIAPEVLPRLFERFYRVESTAGRVSGLGVGLYIARSFVEAHGGQMWAESAGPGQGSTCTFTLPLGTVDEGD